MNSSNNLKNMQELYDKRTRYSRFILGGLAGTPVTIMMLINAVNNVAKVESGELESTWLLSPAVFLYKLFGITGVWFWYAIFVFLMIGILLEGILERNKLVKSVGKEAINEAINVVNQKKLETLNSSGNRTSAKTFFMVLFIGILVSFIGLAWLTHT